ncbi:MAG: GNAT family N-acetyltransferase [Planctomycetales bacterium]|nr:GNAT family N-acetyltransferase [Planctomycetales bacterium]
MRTYTHRYYKRFRMELDLYRWSRPTGMSCPDYRLLSWSPALVDQHGEVKYFSFRDELDAVVFPCLGQMASCIRLMQEISDKDGFVPEATWLAEYVGAGPRLTEYCGTIQAIRISRAKANLQNVGVTPLHRGRGVAKLLLAAALTGLQQVGVTRVGLEVTAENHQAVGLYRRMGFRAVKTLYKAVEPETPANPAAAV